MIFTGVFMDAKVIWLFVFVAMYWSYCLFIGIKAAIASKTATDYFVVSGGLSTWIFILAATATSFSAWTFIGHPALIYRDGFQYAYASLYAIVIPLTGVLFLKRQWILGKRFGFITPGEMFASYFNSHTIRILVVLVAAVFSVPYLGIQLRASGYLFHVLSDGLLDINTGMWLLSSIVLLYVVLGGLRAVAYIDSLQAVLLVLGLVAISLIAYSKVGGFEAFNQGIAQLALDDTNRTSDGYSHYLAIPGIFTSGEQNSGGGIWSSTMLFTYMIALLGVQASPAFSMWAFANKDAKPFAMQQVWFSAFIIGCILVIGSAIQGFSGHLLGANNSFLEARPALVEDHLSTPLQQQDLMQTEQKQELLVPLLINTLSEQAPWLIGLLAVCALAAMQSTGAVYMSTFSSMFTRDIVQRYMLPKASNVQQMMISRLITVLIVLSALSVATHSTDALVLIGGMAMAYGLQLWPALVAVCWWPFLTRQGITSGLIAGITVVSIVEMGLFSDVRWPLSIHSAGWGIVANILVAITLSFVTQDPVHRTHRLRFHQVLRDYAALPTRKRAWIPFAWLLAVVWFYFSLGPGAIIGNTFFGNPHNIDSWSWGIAPIWSWQIVWWAAGVFMLWFFAYKMELSLPTKKSVKPFAANNAKPASSPDRESINA